MRRAEAFDRAMVLLQMAERALEQADAAPGDVENLRVFRAMMMAQAAAGYFDDPQEESN